MKRGKDYIFNFNIQFIPDQWTLGFNIILGKFSISLVDMKVSRLSSIIVIDIGLGEEMITW